MRVHVRTNHTDIPAGAHQGVELRVRLALSRIAHELDLVTVHLVDVDTLDGEVDTLCRVRVSGQDGWTITAMDADHEPLWALGSALRRASEAIAVVLRTPVRGDNSADLAS